MWCAAGWFWWYSFLNTFLGAVLGGGVFSQLGSYIQNPSSLLDHIGASEWHWASPGLTKGACDAEGTTAAGSWV